MRPHHGRHHGFPGRRGHTLRRALLFRFIAAVVITGACVSSVFWMGGQGDRGSWADEVVRVSSYVKASIEARPEETAQILDTVAREFEARLILRDHSGVVVVEAGGGLCRRPIVVPVRWAAELGTLEACRPQPGGPPFRAVASVVVAIAVLSLFAGASARRITWPLRQLAETARKIGEGDLSARAAMGHHPFIEVRLVADALADMATRIERELSGQRALLAGVSHELRTPLGHLRLLIDTARDAPSTETPRLLDEIEQEVIELDSLLSKLLAQARLDFARLERRPVDLKDVTTRALQRAGVDVGLLTSSTVGLISGDATLLSRAIANLLENAQLHGGGVTAVTLEEKSGNLRIVVDDEGGGVAPADRERIFLPFVNSSDRGKGALGLGLHLVQRIAEAHGGAVVVEERARGARFVLVLPI
ncbi:MAG: HAMP domain-containing sensor histidine kinase [Deltaproteobacteria bacterium]|nr:HAMP domain-containing sensor histidine kinase [Deltaproteobacteria bacterium]